MFNQGNGKVGRVWDDRNVFGQKFPGEKKLWDGALL
jgi:hypothetical protein